MPHLAALPVAFALLPSTAIRVAFGENGDPTIISDDSGSISRALPEVI